MAVIENAQRSLEDLRKMMLKASSDVHDLGAAFHNLKAAIQAEGYDIIHHTATGNFTLEKKKQ